MAGRPSDYPPQVPADAPSWATALTKNIIRWVEAKLAGPVRITSYEDSDRPSASNFARSIIFDAGNAMPMCADDKGAWNWMAAYTTGTAMAVSNIGTINNRAGKLTTGSLSTPAGSGQTLTIANALVEPEDMVFCSVANGTNTPGMPVIADVAVSAGSIAVDLRNAHASAAFDGTLIISFFVAKA